MESSHSHGRAYIRHQEPSAIWKEVPSWGGSSKHSPGEEKGGGREGRGGRESGGKEPTLLFSVLAQKTTCLKCWGLRIYSVNNLPTETINDVDKSFSIYYGCLWVIGNHSLPFYTPRLLRSVPAQRQPQRRPGLTAERGWIWTHDHPDSTHRRFTTNSQLLAQACVDK